MPFVILLHLLVAGVAKGLGLATLIHDGFAARDDQQLFAESFGSNIDSLILTDLIDAIQHNYLVPLILLMRLVQP